MLKAILYYILFLAEYLITIFMGGFLIGLYMAMNIPSGSHSQQIEGQEESIYPFIQEESIYSFIMVIGFLAILIVWFTFGHYKFSRFSLGKVIPAAKWKAMTICTMPILGFTMVFYSIMNLFHLDFLPKQMMEISYLGFLPYNIIGSFISAYIFFGAIQEELIRCGKKRWVQLLTLSIMMLPACMMSVTPSGDINVDLTVLGFITLCYCSWIYSMTRSTIILIVLYFVSNLVPFHFESKALGILLLIAGTALTIGGFAVLSRKLPEMLVKDENE